MRLKPAFTCPAFGDEDLSKPYVTTAATGVEKTNAGKSFAIKTGLTGIPEYRVAL
ncbi:MAG: hypothetical protein HWE23_02540 [Rhodobacteraceae bacterium]|nr:hypothetical protein [Paracoccaceae bacterium]